MSEEEKCILFIFQLKSICIAFYTIHIVLKQLYRSDYCKDEFDEIFLSNAHRAVKYSYCICYA